MKCDRGTKAIIICGLIVALLVPSPSERFTEDKLEEPPAVEAVAEYHEQRSLYDVPLSNEVQRYIFNVADCYDIEPALVLAVIERESSYNTEAVGDGGESYGLMQIQPRWHIERMDRLGVEDLLNPYQNISVGVDILAGHIDTYGDVGAALTAYNRGSYNGTVSEYAEDVLERKERIENEQCKAEADTRSYGTDTAGI